MINMERVTTTGGAGHGPQKKTDSRRDAGKAVNGEKLGLMNKDARELPSQTRRAI